MRKNVGGIEKVINFNISFTNNVFCIVTTDAPDINERRYTVCIQNILKSTITKSNFTANSVSGRNHESLGDMSFIVAIGN